jgi:hypothetical protein
MRLTTETALGNILFNTLVDAETFVAEMTEIADEGESFEIKPYQGNRYHVARFYNGTFEAYC